MMYPRLNVSTIVENNFITQIVSEEWYAEHTLKYTRQCIDVQNEQVRQALISLGWTSPLKQREF